MWNRNYKVLYYFGFIRSVMFLLDFSAFILRRRKKRKTENFILLGTHTQKTTEFRNRIT